VRLRWLTLLTMLAAALCVTGAKIGGAVGVILLIAGAALVLFLANLWWDSPRQRGD
jgi:hypothetical protein